MITVFLDFCVFTLRRRLAIINGNCILRSLYLHFEKEIDYYGIKALRFIPPKEMLQSPLDNELNKCFCTEFMGCMGDGFLDMSPCAGGESCGSLL